VVNLTEQFFFNAIGKLSLAYSLVNICSETKTSLILSFYIVI